jgi:MoaA/NifB/PqqE/SkfB family radical SAM enzyme
MLREERALNPGGPAASAAPSGPDARPGVNVPAVDWWITSRCNLACDFCYGPEPGKDPVALRGQILSAIADCSTDVVTFCGGEPLLVREVDVYARQLADRGKRTVLNTNGSLLLRRLAQGFGLAFSAVGLSIDGSNETVHRAMRGMKADLSVVLAAAERVLAESGISLKLATVVSAVNQHDLPSLAGLVGLLKPDIWRLYQYSGRGAQNSGQQRHTLPGDVFSRIAEDSAQRAAPVLTVPASEEQTAGCLIVDPAGDVLVPTATGYARQGNCLKDPIDEIWARIASPGAIIENKRWHSVLDNESAGAGEIRLADRPAGHYSR